MTRVRSSPMAGEPAAFSELLARARVGDRAAREAVATRMLEIAHAIASRRLGRRIRRREDSLDICQVAVTDAVEHLEAFTGRDEAALRRWLADKVEQKICDKVAHHDAAKRAIRREEPLPSRASLSPRAREESPSMAAVRSERKGAVRAAIRKLEAPDRLLVALVAQGKPWEEVATCTGAASPEAARKRYERLVKALARELAPRKGAGSALGRSGPRGSSSSPSRP